MPYCYVADDQVGKFIVAESNYRQCRNLVMMEFADPSVTNPSAESDDTQSISSDAVKKIKEQSSGMIALESALKKTCGDQKGRIVQDKLQSILTKTSVMQSHMDLLREYMAKFDAKLPCVATKCD
jgi:hypothetical protein